MGKDASCATPREIALAFVARMNGRDFEGLRALMSPDHTFIDADGVEHGPAAMRDGYAGYIRDYPSYQIHVEQVLASGGDVALIGRVTGSHFGSADEATRNILWVVAVRDGRVARWHIFA